MSSPSDAAPDRSPAAGEETKSRLSRKRVTVITATALSLLEACGLEPSPSRSEKTAGKGPKTAQEAAPAGKAPANDREKSRQRIRHLPGAGTPAEKRRPRRARSPGQMRETCRKKMRRWPLPPAMFRKSLRWSRLTARLLLRPRLPDLLSLRKRHLPGVAVRPVRRLSPCPTEGRLPRPGLKDRWPHR